MLFCLIRCSERRLSLHVSLTLYQSSQAIIAQKKERNILERLVYVARSKNKMSLTLKCQGKIKSKKCASPKRIRHFYEITTRILSDFEECIRASENCNNF